MSRFRQTELGLEARCSKCGEWWPADSEFFYMLHGRPHSWCKACYIADRVAKGVRRNYGARQAYMDHAREVSHG
jgi:hypothetical protein